MTTELAIQTARLDLAPRSPVRLAHTEAGMVVLSPGKRGPKGASVFTLPPIYPEWLGERTFTRDHAVRFAYVVGEMARGLATPRMVVAAARAGCLGFYGSAGLQVDTIAEGLSEIEAGLGGSGASYGANVIHTPQQPGYEAAVIDLFLARGVRRVSASAYMRLSPELVRYTALGLSRGNDGRIVRSNHVFAKVSRAEVARQFMAPAPEAMLRALVDSGAISPDQATLAAAVPVAGDITAESDSGGHTDNRPAGALFASLMAARAEICAAHGLSPATIRIGLAGGLGTPQSVAAAFQMGAAYVLTGSINQAAVESGLSLAGREQLAKAGMADVAMAPAADMFEQGVKVQVLKRGTLFAMRAEKLYALYRSGASYGTLSPDDRKWLDGVLGEPFAEAWAATRDYMQQTAPKTLEQAERDPNKQFALVCRRYLFMGAQWAREGTDGRAADYQIWCGPAMGAFNDWARGSVLEPLENRTVHQIAWNLMEGAAHVSRAAQMRSAGLDVAPEAFAFAPRVFAT